MDTYFVQKAFDSLAELCRDHPLNDRLDRCRTQFVVVGSGEYIAELPVDVRKALHLYQRSAHQKSEIVHLRDLIATIFLAHGRQTSQSSSNSGREDESS